MAVTVAKRSVYIRASKQTVWRHLHRLHEWPRWSEAFLHVDAPDPVAAETSGKILFDTGAIRAFAVTSVKTGEALVVLIPALNTSFECEIRALGLPEGSSVSVVTVAVEGRGWLKRVVVWLSQRKTGAVLEAVLAELKLAAEAAEGRDPSLARPAGQR